MASGLTRLKYDPAAASSSHSVGSYVLAGDDGTQIGHVSDALKVDIGSVTDLDIRDLLYTQDSVTAHQGGTWTIDSITNDVNIADGGNSITVDAVNLDIRDLTAASDNVAAYLADGAGTALTSTLIGADQALDVNVVGGDIDDSLANTAIDCEATAVSTTLISVTGSPLANRKWLCLSNEGNKSLFWGTTGDTAASGFPLHPGFQHFLRVGAANDLKIIGETGASAEDLRVGQLS